MAKFKTIIQWEDHRELLDQLCLGVDKSLVNVGDLLSIALCLLKEAKKVTVQNQSCPAHNGR